MNIRKLPIGTQSFEKLRSNGCVYVDKTALVWELANTLPMAFLSRPRRFGKSLLVSTLEAYFSGRRELFKGLAIEKLESDWDMHPVIRIDFSIRDYGLSENFDSAVDEILSQNEQVCRMKRQTGSPSSRLKRLIEEYHRISGKTVVILVDEYDKPMLDALYSDHEEANREKLRDFYSPLKACDEHLRFVFLTGITKISHVNIFSGLNQLKDISLSDKYSSVCGITGAEVARYFALEIQALSDKYSILLDTTLEKLRDMYDGYHFSAHSDGVYNPFCLLCAFEDLKFGSYWMSSGTPSALIRRLQNDVIKANRLIQEGCEVDEMFFADYDSNSPDISPLLYQEGYLTIIGYKPLLETYRLGFPNREVAEGLMRHLLPKYLDAVSSDYGTTIEHLRKALAGGDAKGVSDIVASCVSGIPTIMRENCENYYESLVHILFRVTGYEVVGQAQSSAGRADIVLQVPECVWIFELKMDGGAKDAESVCDAALGQIDAKGYAKPYLASGKTIRKVALVFSSDKKGLVAWKESCARS